MLWLKIVTTASWDMYMQDGIHRIINILKWKFAMTLNTFCTYTYAYKYDNKLSNYTDLLSQVNYVLLLLLLVVV
jgi:hypothetical protein